MAHAAANLTYIIYEASESEQQHMFPHDACGLEVQQRCDSTPLSSDGNFSPLISEPKWVSKQGTGCVMPPGGVGPAEIIFYGYHSERITSNEWQERRIKQQSVMLAEWVHSR